MTFKAKTFNYAGIELSGYVTDDDREWVTVTILAEAVEGGAKSARNWWQRNKDLEWVQVLVDIGNGAVKVARAYLVEDVISFLKYREKLGDRKAEALLTAVVIADLRRSVREACGFTVTAEQHEATRAAVRLELIERFVLDGGYGVHSDGRLNYPATELLDAQGYTPVEKAIATSRIYIEGKRQLVANGRASWADVQEGIRGAEAEIQELARVNKLPWEN